MTSSLKHVGLDVHQATTVAAVRNDGGRVIARTILPTEPGPLLDYFRGMGGTIRVALEEGTQAQWLYDLLTPVVAEVIVCDRRGESVNGNKADCSDAVQLSDLLRRGALRPVYHAGSHRATIRELARCYQSLVDDSTRVMLRLKALFRARGIRTPGRTVYRSQQDWLRRLPDAGARFRAETLYPRPAATSATTSEGRAAPGSPA
jgi:hypothetical protein